MKDRIHGRGSIGRIWPSPPQDRLLRAVLGPEDEALGHYRAWLSMVDLRDDVDPGTYRLMPLLYHTLSRLGHVDAQTGRLKGTYRRSWCETQTTLATARDLIARLQARGIDVMVTKGLALGLDWYPNPTLRPMGDLDLVVPRDRAREAIAALESWGWRPGPTAYAEDLDYHHARQFFHPDGAEVDLHWCVMLECRRGHLNDRLWRHAIPLQAPGLQALQLDATDQLLHAIVHGVHWNEVPSIRWIVDAATVLRRQDRPVDWSRLVDFAHEARLGVRLHAGLEYLARLGLAVPEGVLSRLAARGPSLVERFENTIAFSDPDPIYRHPVTKNWVIFARYCRIDASDSPIGFLRGLGHFMRIKHQVRGRSELPGVFVRGVLRRLLRGAAGPLPLREPSSR